MLDTSYARTALRGQGRPASGEVAQQRNSFCIERQLAKPPPHLRSTGPPPLRWMPSSMRLAPSSATSPKPRRNHAERENRFPVKTAHRASALKETQIKIVIQMSQMWKEHRIEN